MKITEKIRLAASAKSCGQPAALLIPALAVVLCLQCLPAQATTIRVGFYPQAGFHEYDHGRPAGYDVEYLEKIRRRTGWSFQFVPAPTFKAALEMLDMGEIDLLGGVQWTSERAARYRYCPYASGTTSVALITLKKNRELIFEDFQRLAGLRIGSVRGYERAKGFADYMRMQGCVPPRLTEYDDIAEVRQAMHAGKLDAFLYSITHLNDDEKVLARYNPTSFFYITGKEHFALMTALEEAIGQLKLNQPGFEIQLLQTYFPQIARTPLNKTELDFIAHSPSLRVGYAPARRPISWMDEGTGQAMGILPDLLRLLAQNSGLRFTFVPMSDKNATPADHLARGDIDLAAGVMINTVNQMDPAFILSVPALRSSMFFFGKKELSFSSGRHLRVALPEDWHDGRQYVAAVYPAFHVQLYADTEACLKAVEQNEADVLLQNAFAVNYLLARPRHANIISLPQSQAFEDARLAVSAAAPTELLSILNKSLIGLDEKQKDQIISDNISTVTAPLDLTDFFHQYQGALFIIAALLLAVGTVTIYALRLRRRNEKAALENERRLAYITDNIDGGVISLRINEALNILDANHGFWQMLGYAEVPPGHPGLAAYIHPEDLPRARERIRAKQCGESTSGLELRLRRRDGGWLPVLLRGSAIKEGDMDTPMHCLVMDITTLTDIRERLAQEEELYRTVLEQSGEVVFDVDMRKRQFLTSPNFHTKFGRECVPFYGADGKVCNNQAVHPDDVDILEELRQGIRNGERTVFAVLRIPAADGRFIWCRVQTTRISKDGAPLRMVGKIVDIDDEVRKKTELERRSQRDSLTDLYNKEAFQEKVRRCLPVSKESGKESALLFVDLDNFKALNDTLGHMTGDKALAAVGKILSSVFRNADAVGRFGGDEFCVFVRGIPRNVLRKRVESLRTALRLHFEENGQHVDLSSSIGVYLFDGNESSYEEALQRADQALYRAKQSGKDRFTFHGETDESGSA